MRAVRAISESLREEVTKDKTLTYYAATDKDFSSEFKEYYKTYGISPAERIALTIKQAIELPVDATWNEIIIRPTNEIM